MDRSVFCEDAISWLQSHTLEEECSLFTSLPDFSEFSQLSLVEWKQWFVDAAKLVLASCPSRGLVIFCQSDIKVAGTWVNKAYLCLKAAEAVPSELLFHKIICRVPAGTVTLGRPVYSHLLCFSKELRLESPTRMMADVSADTGEKTWVRGMGLRSAIAIVEFIKNNSETRKIVNPFCGEGSMLAAANHLGLEAIGIERSPKRAEKSRQLKVNKDGSAWL